MESASGRLIFQRSSQSHYFLLVLAIQITVEVDRFPVARKDYERQGVERLQAYIVQAQERGIDAEISQNLGDAGRMICEVAKSWSVDAIVMGRNQKSMLSEIWLGSTSNYVLHHAPCSTLVIQLPAI